MAFDKLWDLYIYLSFSLTSISFYGQNKFNFTTGGTIKLR